MVFGLRQSLAATKHILRPYALPLKAAVRPFSTSHLARRIDSSVNVNPLAVMPSFQLKTAKGTKDCKPRNATCEVVRS